MRSDLRPVTDTLHTPATVLRASGLGKRFDIYPNDRSRIFEFLGSRSHHREHWAVRGLDLELRAGEALGIIGNNGAGKSTILRLLAGITEPTEGSLDLPARLSALLDLGVGFQEGFTGRENIVLGCQLLGLTEEQVENRMPEMIRFAELGQFIDDPVRTYSSGMALRLGFAVAVHVDAEVLLIDEVLAVGDPYFQRKCIRRIEALFQSGTSLVLVSHDLHAVRALCTQVIWMEGGQERMRGPARQVVEAYLDQTRVQSAQLRVEDSTKPVRAPQPSRPMVVRPGATIEPAGRVSESVQRAAAPTGAAELFSDAAGEAPRVEEGETLRVSGTGEARILQVQLLDETGVETTQFRSGESVVVAVTFRTIEPIEDPIFGVALFRNDGTYVYGPNTGFDNVFKGNWSGVYTFFLHYPEIALLAGSYRVSVAIYDKGHVSPMAWHNQLYEFQIVQDVEDHGLVHLPHRWGVIVHHDESGAR